MIPINKDLGKGEWRWKVIEINGNKMLIALDIGITPELRTEWFKNELTHFINSLRRELKLTKENKIDLYYQTSSEQWKLAINNFIEVIKEKCVIGNIIEGEIKEFIAQKEFNNDGEKITIYLKKTLI